MCILRRDGAEQPDSNLSDMLQQLASVNTARPSERDYIRQGNNMNSLHLASEVLLLYFNGKRRHLYDRRNQSILHAFVHKAKQNVFNWCFVSLKMIHSQTVDKHNAMIFFLFLSLPLQRKPRTLLVILSSGSVNGSTTLTNMVLVRHHADI